MTESNSCDQPVGKVCYKEPCDRWIEKVISDHTNNLLLTFWEKLIDIIAKKGVKKSYYMN